MQYTGERRNDTPTYQQESGQVYRPRNSPDQQYADDSVPILHTATGIKNKDTDNNASNSGNGADRYSSETTVGIAMDHRAPSPL